MTGHLHIPRFRGMAAQSLQLIPLKGNIRMLALSAIKEHLATLPCVATPIVLISHMHVQDIVSRVNEMVTEAIA